MRGFRSSSSVKAALKGKETFRTIKKGQIEIFETGVLNEIEFVARPFTETAQTDQQKNSFVF